MFNTLVELLSEKTLERKWWRKDSLWTNWIIFSTPLRFAPYFFDRWALARSQYWERAKLGKLQERRLAALFSHAATIPFWRSILANHSKQHSAKDYLRTLPVISRATFQPLTEDQYCSTRYMRDSLKDSTSGSTSTPFTYYMDRGTLVSLWAVRDREFVVAAGGKRYPVFLFRGDHRVQQRFYNAHFVYLRGYNDIPERFAVLQDSINHYAAQGAVLYLFASGAVALAEYARREHKHIPLKAVVAVGESISPENRSFVEESLKTRFSLTYATLESSSIAFECEQGRNHMNEEELIVEILDADDVEVPDGQEGRVVITHLSHRVMPLIRYYNGDVGTISKESCPCGRSLRTLSIIGRSPTLIRQKGGYTVTLTELTVQLNYFGQAVKGYQILHRSPEEFIVKIIPGPEYETIRENMEGKFRRKLHPDTKVVFETVDSIESSPSGKARYYMREFSV